MPRAWPGLGLFSLGPELCTPFSARPALPCGLCCTLTNPSANEATLLPSGVACSTHTQLQKSNKRVLHAADPSMLHQQLPSLPPSSLAFPYGHHFIWYFLQHFQVRFSQQQRGSSFYICIFLRIFFLYFLPGLCWLSK